MARTSLRPAALNTSGKLSHLPGRPYPEGTPDFPSRDQMVEHLERHAAEDGIDRLLDTTVDCIDRNDDGWLLWTSAGKIHARQLIVATGHQNTPFTPEWKGLSDFKGELLHSADYRNPEPYRGKKVLVVGSGNSGMEIAHDLAEGGASEVRLSVRTPPNIIPLEGASGEVIASVLYKLPLRVGDAVTRFNRRQNIGDLSEYGLPVPEEGLFSRLRRLGQVPPILSEEVIESIKERKFEVVGAVESLDATGVQLADGERIEPDAVICATGYRTGLEPLVGHLGVLDEQRACRKAVGRQARRAGAPLRRLRAAPGRDLLLRQGGEARGEVDRPPAAPHQQRRPPSPRHCRGSAPEHAVQSPLPPRRHSLGAAGGSCGRRAGFAMLDREEAGRSRPYGEASVGCGSGIWTVELAKRGWEVTGIDVIPRAVARARERAREARVEARFIDGDVAALRAAGVREPASASCSTSEPSTGFRRPSARRWERVFFWVSHPEATHSQNLRERPELGIVIFDSTVPRR